ncbi:MAG: archease [Candidatus Micrarchaeota archaeon]|nr:archease [Candidatus Micrarchaeota archaeon]
MARARFKYMPHTADVEFIAYGRSFKGLLENAALAMLGVMFDAGKIRRDAAKARTARITERATNEEDMLWFALQKIVSKVDEKKLNAFGFKVNMISKSAAGMVLHGCIFYKRTKRYAALLDVKGVTPHGLKISRGKNGYSARVTVDV